jgi:hypothetical protein
VLDSLASFKQIGIRIVERSDDLPVTAGEGGPAVSGRGLAGVCLGISGYAGYTANYIPRVCACNRYFAKCRRYSLSNFGSLSRDLAVGRTNWPLRVATAIGLAGGAKSEVGARRPLSPGEDYIKWRRGRGFRGELMQSENFRLASSLRGTAHR